MKVVIITGPTGSGKSTLSNLLFKNLNNAFILGTDNYYSTGFISNLLSNFINAYFDKPISFNKKLFNKDIKNIVETRKTSYFLKYDFILKKRIKIFKDISNIDYLIVEGIFALEIMKLIEENDYILIKMQTNKTLCKERACRRDVIERGKTQKKALHDFINAWQIYKRQEEIYKLKEIKDLLYIKKPSDIKKILKKLTTNTY